MKNIIMLVVLYSCLICGYTNAKNTNNGTEYTSEHYGFFVRDLFFSVNPNNKVSINIRAQSVMIKSITPSTQLKKDLKIREDILGSTLSIYRKDSSQGKERKFSMLNDKYKKKINEKSKVICRYKTTNEFIEVSLEETYYFVTIVGPFNHAITLFDFKKYCEDKS